MLCCPIRGQLRDKRRAPKGYVVINDVEKKPKAVRAFQHILFISSLVILPCLQFTLFSWIYGVLPLISFVYLNRYGFQRGNKLILQSLAVAATGCIFFQSFGTLLFAITMLPCGYIVAHSAANRLNPVTAGIRAGITMSICWLMLWLLLTAGGDAPAYAAFIQSLDEGVEEALKLYRQSETVSTESLRMIEQTLYQMKVYIPRILPSLIMGLIIFTVWMTMALGNHLLLLLSGKHPWVRLRFWQLPEKLIWFFIASAICTIIPAEPMRTIGVNLLLITSLIYCLQGISILIFFFNKWNLPKLFRAVLYVMIVFQSFGTVFLIGVGIADVWLNFRRLDKENGFQNNHETT